MGAAATVALSALYYSQRSSARTAAVAPVSRCLSSYSSLRCAQAPARSALLMLLWMIAAIPACLASMSGWWRA